MDTKVLIVIILSIIILCYMCSGFMSNNNLYVISSTEFEQEKLDDGIINYDDNIHQEESVTHNEEPVVHNEEPVVHHNNIPILMDIPTEFGYGGFKVQPGKYLDEELYYKF
jgi:hypothetical protein